MEALRPVWRLNYESKEVTSAISPMVLGVTYTDYIHGKSDDVSITIEDSEALWHTGWWPAKGDRIVLDLGYQSRPLLPCGRFQVDQVDTSGPPDVVTVRALAAGIDSAMRTKQNRAFEETTLKLIAELVAGELALELVGTIEEVPIVRCTQNDETPLEFLSRLAEEQGYAFSVRDTRMVFYKLSDLETAAPVAVLERRDLKQHSFRSTTQHTYIACEVSFFDPISGENLKHRVWVENMRVRGDEVEQVEPEIPETIQYGDKGKPLVGEWQSFLKPRGMYDYVIDDWFLDITFAGTKAFQKEQQITVDGIVGPETWRAAIAVGFRGGLETNVIGEVLYETIRVESVADAERKARALLNKANRLQATGSITVAGNELLVAGSKVELRGLYRLSGMYIIDKSVHAMQRSGGYDTKAELTHVP